MSSDCTLGGSDASEATIARRRVRPALAELSGDEFNDLNSTLEPALDRARQFDALWSVHTDRGDVVAALAAGIAAAGCRSRIVVHAS
jgi:hypothetical protein